MCFACESYKSHLWKRTEAEANTTELTRRSQAFLGISFKSERRFSCSFSKSSFPIGPTAASFTGLSLKELTMPRETLIWQDKTNATMVGSCVKWGAKVKLRTNRFENVSSYIFLKKYRIAIKACNITNK